MPHVCLCICLLKNPVWFFFSPSFCDLNLWLFLCLCFQPQSLLLLLQNRKAKGEEWLGLVACVSVRPQQHFPGAGLLPACSSLPSIVDSVLHVPQRVVGVFLWEGGTLLLSPLLCPPGFTCVFLEVGGLCSHLGRGSKGKISTFQCYSYAAELKNKLKKKLREKLCHQNQLLYPVLGNLCSLPQGCSSVSWCWPHGLP